MFTVSCTTVKARNRQVNPEVQQDLAVNANQIRLRMRSLVDPFAGEIEQAADRISATASNPSVKRAAIRWKIEGVPALRGALFQPDPFTAVLDTWVFTYQMTDYFEVGPGRITLGDAAPLAVETSRHLEEEFAAVVATFTKSGDVSKVRAYARKWASDHPIRYAIQDRETTLSRVVETDVGVTWSLGEAVAEITTTADDVHREIQIYSDHLFRQARWEAELLMVDLPGEEVLQLAARAVKSSERAVDTIDRLAPALESAADAASNAPTLVTSERKAAVDAMREELTRTLAFLQGERIASLQQISEERLAVLSQVTVERIAAIKELREVVVQERLALSRDIEQAGLGLVDHAARRVTQLAAAIFAAFVLTGVLFLFLIRKLFFSPHEPHGWLQRDVHGRL